MAKGFRNIFVILLALLPFLFVGCNKDNGNQKLSFNDVGDYLIKEDNAFREFSTAIKAANSSNENITLLEETVDYIANISSVFAVQLGEYENTISQFSSGGNTHSSIERTANSITICTQEQKMEVSMKNEDAEVSILFSSSETFYVYELVNLSEFCYLAQMVSKTTGENYTIYKYKFNGTSGVLSIDYSTHFDTILNKENTYDNFKVIGEYTFTS